MHVRKATLPDVPHIAELVNLGVREGQLLPRSVDAIRASIGDWVVVEDASRIVGCGSLLAMGPALGEVRSLAVAPEYRKNGVGAKIVDALVAGAQARSMPVVFALTRVVSFFERMGFTTTARESFPEKVWRDCVICPARLACDETAVVKLLSISTKDTKEH
jgi:amino-acid N-acetyltransferase